MSRQDSFNHYLSCFSKEEYPITLSEESVRYFSQHNKALPQDLIRRFITQQDDGDDDPEYTEYIACCRIPDTGDIHAVVYWKGSLMKYDYVLITYNKNGVVLHRKTIAGTRMDGNKILRSIATIDDDWIINIVVGGQSIEEKHYDPRKSHHLSMELLINGEIIITK